MEDEAGGILNRSALIGLNSYWKQKRFAYDGSGNIEYIGFHDKHSAETSDKRWVVWKLTYTGDDITLIEGPLTDIWDNHAALDWK